MSDPVKYLSVVSAVVEIYQNELISMFKKSAHESLNILPDLIIFKSKLDK